MQSDKDSLKRLIEDVDRAAASYFCVCGYFDKRKDDECVGCRAADDDGPCETVAFKDIARRLHALMPHDMDGREIKVGDTIKWANGCRCDKVCGMVVRATDKDGFSLTNNKDNYIVVQPDSWEKLEADANMLPHDYLTTKDASDKRYGAEAMTAMTADLVRRAKKLAGVE